MSNECDYCVKSFTKLSQLYIHKNTHTPSLLLHQHPHPAFGNDAKQLVPVNEKQSITDLERRIKPYDKKRKSDTKNLQSLFDDEQRNSNSKVVDIYDGSVKRKRDDNNSNLEIVNYNDKRRKVDNETDSGLEDVDSYDKIENKIKREIEKKNRVKNKKN